MMTWMRPISCSASRLKLHSISDRPVQSAGDFHQLQFNLLGKSMRVHQPLSAIENLLTDEFLRINRSFIVRCSAITAITANAVELISRQQLPIGITYRELVRERLRTYMDIG